MYFLWVYGLPSLANLWAPSLFLPLCSLTLLIAVPFQSGSDPLQGLCLDDFWDLLVIFPWLSYSSLDFYQVPSQFSARFCYWFCAGKNLYIKFVVWRVFLWLPPLLKIEFAFFLLSLFPVALWRSGMIHNWATTKVLLEVETYFTIFSLFCLSCDSRSVI